MRTIPVEVMGRFARGKYWSSWCNGIAALVRELERLNSARLGRERLSQLSASARVRAVKDALAAHHQGSRRCC